MSYLFPNKVLNKTTESITLEVTDQKHIPNGEFTVDLEDYDKIKDVRWSLHNGYIENRNKGKLHRLILGMGVGSSRDTKVIDHINRNKQDNRKSNLRITTKSINNRNSVARGKYPKNIWFHERLNKWEARVRRNGKLFYFGVHSTMEEAIEAKKKGEILLLGTTNDTNYT